MQKYALLLEGDVQNIRYNVTKSSLTVLKVVIQVIYGVGEEIKFTFPLLCCLCGCNFCAYNV